MKYLAVLLLLPAFPAAAETPDIVFSIQKVEECIAGAQNDLTKIGCIGRSAAACMGATGAGSTTYGMGACIDQELTYWDDMLNAQYRQAMARAEAVDAEMAGIDSAAPPQAPALRDMQRAWISYRNAKCEHAASLWVGGTGAGPASLACMMNTTGEQAIYLEGVASF